MTNEVMHKRTMIMSVDETKELINISIAIESQIDFEGAKIREYDEVIYHYLDLKDLAIEEVENKIKNIEDCQKKDLEKTYDILKAIEILCGDVKIEVVD